jgi:hypothetical protein
MSSLPPVAANPYNHFKHGDYGEFGAGAGTKVMFLQTAISKTDLDHITLIENIEGSERWDIQNLFQRDVDKGRVMEDIIPYLRDKNKVKFFNPLTLAVLPLDDSGSYIIKELASVDSRDENQEGHTYRVHEWPGYFEFRQHSVNAAFSTARWNSDKVRIVAIDGQHRLSALKRWSAMPGGAEELGTWTIPVVMIGIVRSAADVQAPDLLEVVRRTFVYINSKAEEVNEARKILLDDESVNAVCTQVLIQDAHQNDVKPLQKRNNSKVPLLLYDWRGVARRHAKDAAPAALFSVQEIHGWFVHYLLGDDGDQSQREALALDDMIPPLESYQAGSQSLTHRDANRIRGRFAETALPGINKLLEEFQPTKEYTTKLRALEAKFIQASDVDRHAFMKIRFGASREPEELVAEVEMRAADIRSQLELLKSEALPELLRRDIGMRGVISAFGNAKYYFDEVNSRTSEWAEHAAWFTDGVNKIYAERWFDGYQEQSKEHRRILTHICFDEAGSIINYKFEQARDGFGALLMFLVFGGRIEEDLLTDVWDDVAEQLRTSLRRGFRAAHRRDLRPTFHGSMDAFKAEVNRRAAQSTEERLIEIGQLRVFS